MNRDGALQSIWQQEIKKFDQPSTMAEVYDVAIIGGGITGVSCAEKLQAANKKCIILEASNIGHGTTGGTTAHINTFFDSSYDTVIQNFGLDNARLLATVGTEAISQIQANINKYQIDCDFEEKDAYLFAMDDNQIKILDDLVEGTRKVGIDITFNTEIKFPIPYVRQAKVGGQAQFHPVKYIRGLTEAYLKMGGVIFEEARVQDIKEDESLLTIDTTRGQIKCKHAIYATHTPPGVNLLHFRLVPWRSYAIAVKLKNNNYPDALGYDLDDPYHYYRSHVINGENLLIAGGNDHKTGHEEDTEQVFKSLEKYVTQYFDIDRVAYSWSSQYYEPVDGLPYIGHLPGGPENLYVATGYNGNGMVFGTISGDIISSLIKTKEHKYKSLFNPSRIKPVAGFSKFVQQGADVVSSFVKGRLETEKILSLTELNNDEAKVVKYDGDAYAIYKDNGGQIHAVSSICTHIKCNVAWNKAEKTWDCPCYGSRFNINGKVLNTPAVKDLQRINFSEGNNEK